MGMGTMIGLRVVRSLKSKDDRPSRRLGLPSLFGCYPSALGQGKAAQHNAPVGQLIYRKSNPELLVGRPVTRS